MENLFGKKTNGLKYAIFLTLCALLMLGGCIGITKEKTGEYGAGEIESESGVATGATAEEAEAGSSEEEGRSGAGMQDRIMGTYYVSPLGSDTNNGSEDAPWKTISHAVSNLEPGDTLIVKAGRYNEFIDFDASGNEENPIRICGESGAVVSGDGISRDGLVLKPNASYIEISGIAITNFKTGWGLALYGSNRKITIKNLEVSNCDTGIHMTAGYSGEEPMFGGVSEVNLENIYVHHNGVGGIDCTPGPCNGIELKNGLSEYNGADAGFGADGFAIEVGNNIRIANFTSRYNGGDGVDIGSRSPLFYSESANVSITDSKIYGNGLNGLKLWNGGEAINTMVYSNGLAGLVLVYDGRYVITNSLVANNGIAARDYGMVVGYDEPEPLGRNGNISLYLFNNILYKNGPSEEPTGSYLGRGVALYSDYNCWFGREDEELYYEKDGRSYARGERLGDNDAHSIYADPVLKSDYSLEAQSPLVNAGAKMLWGVPAPLFDIEGKARGVPDMGPYEANP